MDNKSVPYKYLIICYFDLIFLKLFHSLKTLKNPHLKFQHLEFY
jgi:hypothetical protein